MPLTGALLLLFAFSIGFATFVENDFGTQAAKGLVYNAKWFEILLLLLVINLCGSIFRYKMISGKKWSILLFHVAFIVIFVGAAVTRYIGYEGMMRIREGETTNRMLSDATYISVWAGSGESTVYYESKVLFSPATKSKFNKRLHVNGKQVDLTLLRFIPSAAETVIEADGGDKYLSMVVSDSISGMNSFFLREGETTRSRGLGFSFNDTLSASTFEVFSIGDELYFRAVDTVYVVSMMGGETEKLVPAQQHPFSEKTLYRIGSVSLVLKKYMPSAIKELVPGSGEKGMAAMDALEMQVACGGELKRVYVYGGKGFTHEAAEVETGDIKINVAYGSRPVELPFSILLRDFQLERYPGSNSPSSYASEVTVYDESRQMEMPYRIFMNNVLNYRGYRFFQSSYDKDEKGTILSVNHDTAGTIITYIGYFLMTLGMVVALFTRSGRFAVLSRMLKKLREKREVVTSFTVLLMSAFLLSTGPGYAAQEESPPGIKSVDARHAASFGELLMQDNDGRIKPLNTLASEVLRKVSRKSSFMGLTPDQVLLDMMADPSTWQDVAMIKVSNPELASFLGITGKYASFNDIVDMTGSQGYRLSRYVDNAYQKKPSLRNKFDNEVLKVDERVNIVFLVFNNSFMTVFPVPEHSNFKWIGPEDSEKFLEGDQAAFVKGILSLYLQKVSEAILSGDWTETDQHLTYIKNYQQKFGGDILPPESRIRMEIVYNNYDIFNKLSRYYGLIGFILLILHFINILRPKLKLKWPVRIAMGLVVILFLAHTAGLVIRWYVSGHAPWSDGYESMIYIGWATVLAGLIFVRRSQITLSVTAMLASLILMVAHLSWMDPEITNLVPVLKSYWLVIHVAIITASYGFLALGSLLGLINLIIMIMRTGRNAYRLNLVITEITHIIEMTLIIGLFMLTIGTFLGGIWANESWGRYWGWDPKETWALVTVLVYAFVVHMRYIPGFRGNFPMSFAALISYSAVMMTYFGVNYYLSGLHSYAKGDAVPVPSFVYYSAAVVTILGVIAYISERKHGLVKGAADM